MPKSVTDPQRYNDVNITGTLNVLLAAKENKVRRVVFASSSSIYGDVRRFPQKETDFPLLISPYAQTKLAGEYWMRVFAKCYSIETVSLRYFNVFGPRQALDDEYAVVIPKFITSILNNQPPPIYGNGKQSRDFTYIDNVVQANLLSSQKKINSCAVFNVALGESQKVIDLVKIINKILKKNIKPKFLPKRNGDVFKTHADISAIKKGISFKPKINFEEGIRRTIVSYQSSAVSCQQKNN